VTAQVRFEGALPPIRLLANFALVGALIGMSTYSIEIEIRKCVRCSMCKVVLAAQRIYVYKRTGMGIVIPHLLDGFVAARVGTFYDFHTFDHPYDWVRYISVLTHIKCKLLYKGAHQEINGCLEIERNI